MPRQLELWTVYDNPADYPGWFVARRFVGEAPQIDVMRASSLESIRAALAGMGLGFYLPRMDGDQPSVVETWCDYRQR